MSLLEHPTAQALWADARVRPADVAHCRLRLEGFLQRYLPRFYRIEQHALARVVLQGKLSNLQRKTSEPIAYQAGRPRKPVQHFVGAGGWDDEAVMAELRRHVAEVCGDPELRRHVAEVCGDARADGSQASRMKGGAVESLPRAPGRRIGLRSRVSG